MSDHGTPQLVGLGVQAVTEIADRLGLTWQLRPGTVASSIAASSTVPVLLDGDEAAVSATSLLGSLLQVGTRVMVEAVPPAGNFIVGYALTGYVANQLTHDTLVRASSNLSLGAADVLVPGTQITVTVANLARYNATGIFDFDETGAGTTVCLGRLYVDGANHSSNAQALLEVTTTNDRATVAQQWDGTLSAGSHTLELRGARSAANGSQVANATHTCLRVQVYE